MVSVFMMAVMRRRSARVLDAIRHGAPWVTVMMAGLVGLVGLGGCGLGFGPGGLDDLGLERASITTQDGRLLSYLRAGDPHAQRVIFIHGTPGEATNFAHFLLDASGDHADPAPSGDEPTGVGAAGEPRMAAGRVSLAGFELVSVDRLGFGHSDPRVEVSFAAQAKAIAALLVQRDGRWPIVVGHSLGGPIAAQLAGDDPDRVGGLVIVSGSLDPALEGPRWYNRLAEFPLIYPLLDRSLQHSNREIMAAREQTEALWAVLPRITAPVVIIHGSDDRLVPVGNVAYTEARLALNPHVQTVVIRGADHFIPWQHADVIRRAVLELGGQLHETQQPIRGSNKSTRSGLPRYHVWEPTR